MGEKPKLPKPSINLQLYPLMPLCIFHQFLLVWASGFLEAFFLFFFPGCPVAVQISLSFKNKLANSFSSFFPLWSWTALYLWEQIEHNRQRWANLMNWFCHDIPAECGMSPTAEPSGVWNDNQVLGLIVISFLPRLLISSFNNPGWNNEAVHQEAAEDDEREIIKKKKKEKKKNAPKAWAQFEVDLSLVENFHDSNSADAF